MSVPVGEVSRPAWGCTLVVLLQEVETRKILALSPTWATVWGKTRKGEGGGGRETGGGGEEGGREGGEWERGEER